ncbi:Two pore calcium channel protein 2 [Bienertia sinuspersici]
MSQLFTHSSFAAILRTFVKREELTVFLTLAWAAWHCRLKAVIEKETPMIDNIARGLLSMVEEYCAHNNRIVGRSVGAARVATFDCLCCPPNGATKVNVDAHVSVERKIKVAVVHRIKACWRPEVAEARDALDGVHVACQTSFSKIMLECDALQVVNAIIMEAKGVSPIFLFYDEICSLKGCFDFLVAFMLKEWQLCVPI